MKVFSLSRILLLAILLALSFLTQSPTTEAESTLADSGPESGQTLETMQAPLYFVPDVGQSEADGSTFYTLTANGRLSFSREGVSNADGILALRFIRANDTTTITGQNKQSAVFHSYIGTNPDNWITNVPTYGELIYDDLYRGVDLHYGSENGELKATYYVAPDADPSQIMWHYDGAVTLDVDSQSGNLIIGLSDGSSLTEHAPIAWQNIDGARVPVEVAYDLTEQNNTQFSLGEYDANLPLVIDPVLESSVFVSDSIYDIAVDDSGNVYITGELHGSQTSDSNVYVSKYNPDFTLAFTVQAGESDYDTPRAISVDDSGNIYVGGHTWSYDLPIINGVQTTHSGGSTAFEGIAMKFASDGTLVFSTYLGSTGQDYIEVALVDDAGNFIVAGTAGKADFLNSYPPVRAHSVSADGFLISIDTDTPAVNFLTFLGGSQYDSIEDVAIADNGDFTLTGLTNSTDFPTVNAIQSTKSGDYDGYIVQLTSNGAILYFSTYLGGSARDEPAAVALDRQGNILLVGKTKSSNFPRVNAFQNSYRGVAMMHFRPR